jgi:hypothetical protein
VYHQLYSLDDRSNIERLGKGGNLGTSDAFDMLVREELKAIMEQREEVFRAYIAKYGFEPDRTMQVEQRMPDGTSRWFLRRRTDEEMAAGSMMGAQL